MLDLTEEQALQKLTAWCSTAEHCESEAISKLKLWSFDPDEVDRIMKKLKDEGFVDDARYCRAFVNDKFRLEKWGKRKIREALSVKKIKEVYVDAALLNISDEDYMAALRSVLKSKERSLHGMDEEVRREKLYRFAQSRGYEAAAIGECLG